MAEVVAVEIEAEQEDLKPGSGAVTEIKQEPAAPECASCGQACAPGAGLDALATCTPSGASLLAVLQRYCPTPPCVPALACRPCAELILVLEGAEQEYLRLRRSLEALLAANPLYAPRAALRRVKSEAPDAPDYLCSTDTHNGDSEDEPLAFTKKKRGRPSKKKSNSWSTEKVKVKKKKYVWECSQCGESGKGGERGLEAHTEATHSLRAALKFEDDLSFDSQDSHFSNGLVVESEDIKVEQEELLVPRRGRPPKRPAPRDKPVHPCTQCDSKFSSLVRLERHARRHAEAGAGGAAGAGAGGRPPYICEVCGAHYKHRRACDIHIAMHKGISDWKCEECNKLFPSKGALQRHNNIHTGKPNYQCDLCGKSFIHTSSFKMHKLAHSGEKRHACGVCGLALMTSSHLKRHLRVHSGEKRYECAQCGKRFSERYNLVAHAKSHEPPAAPPAAAALTPAAAAPRKHHFRCQFCSERYERRYMLERHMTAEHGRALERPAPRPRNTMSKLLKAQARAKLHETVKQSDSRPASRAAPASPPPPDKLHVQLGSGTAAGGAWASFPPEYPRAADFPH